MRWRHLIWLVVGLLLVAAFWWCAFFRPGSRHTTRSALQPRAADTALTPAAPASNFQASRSGYRLTNTTNSLAQLLRSDHAILLENALFDTDQPLTVAIPAPLRSAKGPGSYIVQARAAYTAAARAALAQAGAKVVAYVPNNSYLVTASPAAAQALAADPQIQAVLPYEPYYKLKPSLLQVVLQSSLSPSEARVSEPLTSSLSPSEGERVPEGRVRGRDNPSSAPLTLNILLFPDSSPAVVSASLLPGLDKLSEFSSPFGPCLQVRCPVAQLPALAQLPQVQEIELAHSRRPVNDLSRPILGVAVDSTSPTNYLGLTGSNVLVNINDTGVDASHPDLVGRVLSDLPVGAVDSNGHGTHVAGIIAGNGAESLTVTNAPGSVLPASPSQFRGQAPAATLFSLAVDPASGPNDVYLQQTAARTNALISNNSWSYAGDTDYDLAAASYDAATRDALPGTSGPQSMLFVFPAGNNGAGDTQGTGGAPNTINSPGTAKNVITVGAIEQARFISNQTWTCSTNGCLTNTPWLACTDTSNQVAAFSGRGNCAPGTEGDFGRLKPDLVAPGTFILSTRSAQWDQNAYYSQTNSLLTPSPDANYSVVLSNLNDSLGPYYRFESGSSLAAAEVSGVLALLEDFFINRLAQTNSPALMKALLINGARSLGAPYDLHVGTLTNLQGWGLPNLTNSLPVALTNPIAGARPMWLFDQEPTAALATGQSRTRLVSLSPAAQNHALRMTLTWSDPPANPVVGLKLVNDLDLIVTNLDSGEVFFGNDIPSGQVFNQPWDTNTSPTPDCINNVENVFLAPPLAAHYSVTVLGRRVNVNAVTANTNDIVQDYALVLSSGNGQIPDALTLTDTPLAANPLPLITLLTNEFSLDAQDVGAYLLGQRAGANPPWAATNTIALTNTVGGLLTVGSPSQWHFYVFTNDTTFTNAAFLTFLPSAAALAAPGLTSTNGLTNAFQFESDVDLYVSRDAALTNLDPAALAAADMSLSRGGTEMVLYSNATPGAYYIGVKAESQEAAEFGIAAFVSELPFGTDDGSGNQLLRGLPAPALVPGGTAAQPGLADVFCLAAESTPVRRVIITNTLTAQSMADLTGTFSHNRVSVTLDNHSTNGPVVQQSFVYDDSAEGDVPGAQLVDGPGSLRDLAGHNAFGQWRLTLADTNQPATNDNLGVFVEQQPDLQAGITPTVLPGACRHDYLYVPQGTTNLTVAVNFMAGTGPVSVQLCPLRLAGSNCLTLMLTNAGGTLSLVADPTTQPPLNSGLYVLQLCNLGPDPATLSAQATLQSSPSLPVPVTYNTTQPLPIADDAISSARLLVTNTDPIASVAVGVRIAHPRVSDLVLSLISPSGNRVLLAENRGGLSTNGMGFDYLTTNVTRVSYSGGPQAQTNGIDTGQTSGSITIGYDFYSLPDDMKVYYDGNLLFDTGMVSYSNTVTLSYGPGSSTLITIVMNQDGNPNNDTAWYYAITASSLQPMYVTFCENTNFTTLPIKFAPTPLTNLNYSSTLMTNGIFYLPEQSLDSLIGQSALGLWQLEIWDSRAGAAVPQPKLLDWQLAFLFQQTVPVPVVVGPGLPQTNLLGSGQVQWFAIDAPEWVSFATNTLLNATAPVNLLFNPLMPPTGTNAGDSTLLSDSTGGVALLKTNGTPAALVPGSRFYLGIQNTNPTPVTFSLEVSFDVPAVSTLTSGVAFSATNSGPANAADYYVYVVSTNAARAQFEINGPTANMALVLRKGVPLPTLSSHDYLSDNPGTNDQLIVVYGSSTPVPLSPGEWFIGAVNTSGTPASYSIMVTEFPVTGTDIVITNQTLSASNLCLTWTSLIGVHYFVQGKTNLNDAQWSAVSPTVTANDVLCSWCVPLPSPYHFFRIHEGLVLVPPALVISSISTCTNGVTLNWTAPTNSQFNVQWSGSLLPSVWSAFSNLVTSTGTNFSFLDDGTQCGGPGLARYYRLLKLP